MTTQECVFIAHVGDPFSISPLVIVSFGGESDEAREIDLEQLAHDRRQIVSYDIRTLVDAFRWAGMTLPRTIIDIGDALRIRSGVSKEQGGENRWRVWSFIEEEGLSINDLQIMRKLVERRDLPPDRTELVRLLKATAKAMREVWQDTISELRRNGEERRFFEIEVPIRQILSARQYLGLRLDVEHSDDLIVAVRNAKYVAFRELAKMIGSSPADLTFHNVSRYLAGTDAADLAQYNDTSQLEQYFKIAQHRSHFAAAFLRYIRAKRALSVLMTINYADGRVYPGFECFGTVTGRILVVDPRLQQLPKGFRGVLAADEGKRLVYFDYAQFEPGILASLTDDPQFAELYKSSDVYSSLSQAIFGTTDHRDLCKSIFLAYCYGMSVERITAVLSNKSSPVGKEQQRTAVQNFFDSLPSLASFRSHAQEMLLREGFVASVFGNRRYRVNKGPLTSKEQRWALNQVIQGTASLIFKQAIIDVAMQFGTGSVLLPMHDAILMQFDTGDETESDVRGIMVRAFEKWCPGVVPRIVIGTFSQAAPQG